MNEIKNRNKNKNKNKNKNRNKNKKRKKGNHFMYLREIVTLRQRA